MQIKHNIIQTKGNVRFTDEHETQDDHFEKNLKCKSAQPTAHN